MPPNTDVRHFTGTLYLAEPATGRDVALTLGAILTNDEITVIASRVITGEVLVSASGPLQSHLLLSVAIDRLVTPVPAPA